MSSAYSTRRVLGANATEAEVGLWLNDATHACSNPSVSHASVSVRAAYQYDIESYRRAI